MRARNLKPGFFSNPDLAECSFAARLCYSGLWCLADREGRLLDRPKFIRGEIFRYDDGVDVDALLDELAAREFIVRYEVDALRCIEIPSFLDHQYPHHTEKPSALPAPPAGGNPPPINGSELHEHSGNEGAPTGPIPGALPEHAGGTPGSTPGSSAFPSALNHECGIMNPYQPPAEVVGARPSIDRPQLALVSGKPRTRPRPAPACPHREILALWAEVLPAMPQHDPERWRGAREEHLRGRWRELAEAKRWTDQGSGLAYFRKLFGYVGRSPFLTGREHDRNRRPFYAELEWLVMPGNFAKVVEGKYHEEASA